MPSLIQTYADRQAERRPDGTAVVMGQERWSYGELFRHSNALARALQSRGCRRGDRVALVVSKSPLAIASILGVLKAGCIYVPIDVESPPDRAARIVGNAEPSLFLTDASGRAVANEIHGKAAMLDADDIDGLSTARTLYSGNPLDPAYILYTSGSTGAPKGVAISHANVWHYIEWATRYFNFTNQDRISGHPPLHFDLSMFDVFAACASGAELHLCPTLLNLSPPDMAAFIRDSELTQWFSVPAALNGMAKTDSIRFNDFPVLRRVLWCGEVLPTPTLRYWMERLPGAQFTNLYGPTETTIASSYYTVSSIPGPEQAIPIGAPCSGEVLLVLDEGARPVAKGDVGELYIGGVGLSSGYWQDSKSTLTAFVQNPFGAGRIYKTGDLARIGEDGQIYFAGRTDSQIKSRGCRIELGEIETALNGISDLKESVVVAISAAESDETRIGCAYSLLNGSSMTTLALKEILQSKLPAYMMPTRWLRLESLPKNANGKINRPLLKDLLQKNTAADGNGDSEKTTADLQERIDHIFSQRLHLKPPSPETDLLENGIIDSLSFVELLAHLEEEFSVRIALDEVDLNHFRSIVQIGAFIRSQSLKDEASHGSHSAA